jgi:hypothetical protein
MSSSENLPSIFIFRHGQPDDIHERILDDPQIRSKRHLSQITPGQAELIRENDFLIKALRVGLTRQNGLFVTIPDGGKIGVGRMLEVNGGRLLDYF